MEQLSPSTGFYANIRNVLVISDAVGATQFISFRNPFVTAPEDARPQFHFSRHLKFKKDMQARFEEVKPDMIVLSRYTKNAGANWVRLAREAQIPILFHIDDDLLNVPASLGEEKFKAYNDPERLRELRGNIEACDLLYVSTPALKDAMLRNGITVPIIAGDVYCSIDPSRIGTGLPATGPVLGYMGTGGHAADLAQITPAIVRLMDEIPGLQFEVFGNIELPDSLQRFAGRVRHIEPVMGDYDAFIARLCSLGWWVGIAPLEDNPFNRCKADTKWVEYSMAGIAVVAADLPVYHRACSDGSGRLASSEDEWYEAMRHALRDQSVRQKMVEAAQLKLRKVYAHDNLCHQVTDILSQAVEKNRVMANSPAE